MTSIDANDDQLEDETMRIAQITVYLRGTKADGTQSAQYSVFERRLADKLSYLDWKLSMLGSEEEI